MSPKKIKKIETVMSAGMLLVGGFAIIGILNPAFAETNTQRSVELPSYNHDNPEVNVAGETSRNIATFLPWNIVEGDPLYVKILNPDKYPQEKIQAVKQSILSGTGMDIDDSLVGKGERGETAKYYLGWSGALSAASEKQTLHFIPRNFEIIESGEAADITIELVDEKNADGLTGLTVLIADEKVNQILKAQITIFDSDNLSPEQLGTIMRHELGHSLGLAHSSGVEDLMHPTIETNFPFISECEIDAIQHLYDGGKTSEVVC